MYHPSSICRSKVNKLQTLWSEVVVCRIMKHTSQFIHARLVLMISTIELLCCICSYLSLVGLAWTSWNQWPHPQRWAAPFFRFIHIIKLLSSSPAHTCTHQKMKMDHCNTAFPGLPYSNLHPLINLLLLNIVSLGIMSSFCSRLFCSLQSHMWLISSLGLPTIE